MASPAAARMPSLTTLRHVSTDAPQRLPLLLELDVGLGHGLAEVARAARLLQQRQQVRAVQDARGCVLPDRKRPGWQTDSSGKSRRSPHDGRRTPPASHGHPPWLQSPPAQARYAGKGRLFPLGKRRVLRLEPRLTKRGTHLRHGGLLLVELEQPRGVVLDVRHDGDGLARGRWLDAQCDRTRSTMGASPQLAPVAAAQGDVLGQRKEQGVEHVGLAHAVGTNLRAPIIRSASGRRRVEAERVDTSTLSPRLNWSVVSSENERKFCMRTSVIGMAAGPFHRGRARSARGCRRAQSFDVRGGYARNRATDIKGCRPP
eukprot:scaffold713_cov60-Phaeocystis_antarctica.AAC.4